MMNKLLIIVTIAGMLMGAVAAASLAEAKSAYIYAYLHGKIPYTCLNEPELYVRISDSKADPKTGEHNKLVGKVTIDNPTKTKYVIKIPVDPKRAPSGLLREYIQVLQHDQNGNDQVVWQQYPRPYTPLTAQEYKWQHSVPTICH